MGTDRNRSAEARYRAINLALLALLAGVLAWTWLRTALPGAGGCLSLAWLGHPCPLCGLTRALAALAAGDPARAQALHPLVVPAAVGLAGETVYRAGALMCPPRRESVRRWDLRVHALLAVAYAAYTAWFWVAA